MKQFWICFFVFLLGLALCVGGIGLFTAGSTFVGTMLLIAGGCGVYGGYMAMKGTAQKIKKQLAEDKEKGEKTLRRQVIRHMVVTSVLGVLLISGIVFSGAIIQGMELNGKAKDLLSRPVDAEVFEDLEELQQQLSWKSGYEKLFFTYGDELEQLEQECEQLVKQRAAEIMAGIDELPVCTSLNSAAQYVELKNQVRALELSYKDKFDTRVRPLVTNYETLEDYANALETLNESYKVKCDLCYGSGSRSCEYCNGSGKKVVEWYSNGDWGEVSYTSYDCTRCGGDGRDSCGRCGGSGGHYEYGDPQE